MWAGDQTGQRRYKTNPSNRLDRLESLRRPSFRNTVISNHHQHVHTLPRRTVQTVQITLSNTDDTVNIIMADVEAGYSDKAQLIPSTFDREDREDDALHLPSSPSRGPALADGVQPKQSIAAQTADESIGTSTTTTKTARRLYENCCRHFRVEVQIAVALILVNANNV